MKPDWKDAPDWANWLTYDKDGWYWFENEPELAPVSRCWRRMSGRLEQADYSSPDVTIKEPRP